MTFSEAVNNNKIDVNNLSVDQLKALKRSTNNNNRQNQMNQNQNQNQRNQNQSQNQNQRNQNQSQNQNQQDKNLDPNDIDQIIRNKQRKQTQVQGLQKRINQIKNS